jgi:hypothetical protein
MFFLSDRTGAYLPEERLRRRLGHENHWPIWCGDGREYCFAATGGRPFPGKRALFLLRFSFFIVGRALFQPAEQLFEQRSPLFCPSGAFLVASGVSEQDLHSFILAFLIADGVSKHGCFPSTAARG